MDKHDRRFRCLPEPSGTWMVWDAATGSVATLGGCALRGRSEDRAKAACEILKRIYRNRLEAVSMRRERFEPRTPDVGGLPLTSA